MKYNIARAYYWILLVIGIVGVFDFAVLIAIGTVINTGIALSGILGVLLIVYSYLKLFKNIIILKNRYIKIPIVILTIVFVLSFLVIEGLIYSSTADESDVKVEYVVLLGAGLKGDQITVTFMNRMLKCLQYLKNNPSAMVVVSGGQGLGETISEAEAMRRFLAENGIANDRILKEDKSTSTFENFQNTKSLLFQRYGDKRYTIMIVTSDFHMFRSKILAKRNGFIAYGIPAETWWGVYPNCFIREYLAVVKSYFMDR